MPSMKRAVPSPFRRSQASSIMIATRSDRGVLNISSEPRKITICRMTLSSPRWLLMSESSTTVKGVSTDRLARPSK
jgi:hypothetical protein